eukprot:TRINITY_DN79950_c0_g1_i1.p1 TRINITY_DN79950_c0_g1~~TRINITY_DN79950_c0_g1_i1.p1  ORF type:complete len:366 (-),score=117.55 TRINITY_DN79950_c0_g1_i1:142-1203(-)
MANPNSTDKCDAAAASVCRDSDDPALTEATATKLKAQGNEAYARGDLEAAVEFWNQAIRRHVDEMRDGQGPSCLSEESLQLERSIYLNLAQGYLKLDNPGKAFRACEVVMHQHPDDSKARFRAAEACLRLSNFDEAQKCLKPLLEAETPLPEALRLHQRLRNAKRAEAEKRKEFAKRMAAGAAGFSDDKPEAPSAEEQAMASRLQHLSAIDPGAIAMGTDISDAAAQAARARMERLQKAEGGDALPVPEVTDLESFAAKALARSKKYNSAMARSRKQSENAQRSLKLDWLRSGRDGSALDEFVSPLTEELRQIEVAGALVAAEAGAEEDLALDAADVETEDQHAQGATMEEMD